MEHFQDTGSSLSASIARTGDFAPIQCHFLASPVAKPPFSGRLPNMKGQVRVEPTKIRWSASFSRHRANAQEVTG